MTIMDPKAAAEAIKAAWDKNPPAPSPDERHAVAFLESVCEHLGVAPDPINVTHVAYLMGKAHIEQHKPSEYPKALNAMNGGRLVSVLWPEGDPEGRAGKPVIFDTPEEEAAYNGPSVPNGQPPAA